MNAESLRSKSLSSLLWKLFERGGNAIVQMAVQIVMARLLTPTDFGALAIMLVFVNLGNVFVQSGLNTALIQANEVDQESYTTVFWMSLGMSAIIYLMCYFSAPVIAAFYSMTQIIWPLRVLCLTFFLSAYFSVQVAKVTRDFEMQKIFVATIVSVIGSGIVGVFVAYADGGLWALVMQQITYRLWYCILLAFQVDWKPTAVFRLAEARELFRFGSKLLLSGLLNTGYQSLSDLIVGTFSADALGIMSQGKKYPASAASMLDGSIQPVMLSAISHVSSDVNRARSVMRRALKSSCYLVTPFMSLLSCTAPALVPLLLGSQWAPSVPYFQVYCLASALLPIHTTNLQSLNAMGRSDLFLRLEIVKKVYGVANLLFCAFVLKSVWLLCCSYLITEAVTTVVDAWPNKEVLHYGYADQLLDLAPTFVLSGVSYIVSSLVGSIRMVSIAVIIIQICVFLICYVGMSVLFHVESFEYLLNTSKNFLSRRR